MWHMFAQLVVALPILADLDRDRLVCDAEAVAKPAAVVGAGDLDTFEPRGAMQDDCYIGKRAFPRTPD